MPGLAQILFQKFDRTLTRAVSFPANFDELERGDRNRYIGDLGEQLAAKFLRHEGLAVLYRNYTAPRGGEVDIVCKDEAGTGLVFVEVKTRTSSDFNRPASAVDKEKRKLITKGGLSWLRELDHPDVIFRFDIVEVILTDGEPPKFTRIDNAFQLEGAYRY
ncbi:MAG: YraN family protein [Verrucomicrobiales bacterium]|nr:YraN family protein [Verrucomicrobiales bacterium]